MKNQETTNSQGNLAAASLQEEGTIDLLELFWTAVHRWKLLLLALLTGALLAGIYHTYMLAPSYQADASIFITSNESIVSISDLQISSELTADYAFRKRERLTFWSCSGQQYIDGSFCFWPCLQVLCLPGFIIPTCWLQAIRLMRRFLLPVMNL